MMMAIAKKLMNWRRSSEEKMLYQMRRVSNRSKS
jgi:hypothetical protein